MHKILLNTAKFNFILTPRSPLLIKSGVDSPNPTLPDMYFVRTVTTKGETIFIPGSSLKGVFRSFAEKVLRTFGHGKACDPLDKKYSCAGILKDLQDSKEIYRRSCRACKLFGNTKLKGRITFTDFYPTGGVKTETRYGIAISRLTHAVAKNSLFDMEVAVQGSFKGCMTLYNFEIWQLGIIALTIKAVNEGLVRIGYGKNRGLGEVDLSLTNLEIGYNGIHIPVPENALWGVGRLFSDEERDGYGLSENDLISEIPYPDSKKTLGVIERRFYSSEKWEDISHKVIAELSNKLTGEQQ